MPTQEHISLRPQSASSIERLSKSDAVERLAEGDASLFSSAPATQAAIKERLGWITLASDTDDIEEYLQTLREEAHRLRPTDVVLIGMGGSSLSTRVMSAIFAKECGDVRLHVLDTTNVHDVAKMIGRLPFESTLFIVSSKSGSTTEPIALGELFFERSQEELTPEDAAAHFIAITDQGTPLSARAKELGWRHVIHARSSVGGRFSALSLFGLVPTLYAGIDIERLVESAQSMEILCRGEETFANPGAQLASFIFDSYLEGRDKLMLVFPERYRVFGMWLEQLIAESLGKDGKGVIPIISSPERIGSEIHNDQCVFVMHEDCDEDLARWSETTEQTGPLFEITISCPYDMGAEFIRWEFAIALLGFLLEVNPFDQPDVAASKAMTNALLDGEPYKADPLELTELEGIVREGDYICILAYLPQASASRAALIAIASKLEQHFGIPAIIARGPRYLHSTGQLYKGGPNTGIFIVVGDDEDTCDIQLPARDYSMRDLFNAQRKGDIMSLIERGRRVITAQSLEHLSMYADQF